MVIMTTVAIKRKTTGVQSFSFSTYDAKDLQVKELTISCIPNFTLADASVGLATASISLAGNKFDAYGGPTDAGACGLSHFVHRLPQPMRVPDRATISWECFQEDGDLDDTASGDFIVKIIWSTE